MPLRLEFYEKTAFHMGFIARGGGCYPPHYQFSRIQTGLEAFPSWFVPKALRFFKEPTPWGMEDKGGHGWIGSMGVCQSGRLKFGNWGEGIESQINCCCADVLSHVQLFATPWTVAHHAPLSMGFSRQKYWSGLPFPTLKFMWSSCNSRVASYYKLWLCVWYKISFQLPHLQESFNKIS